MGAPLKLAVLLALVALVANASCSSADANFCQGCRALVSFSRQFNSTSQRGEYQDLFKRYCELYYPASTDFQQGPCQLFVDGLFYVLDRTDPISHCDQIGACEPSGSKAAQPSDDIYEYISSSAGSSGSSSNSNDNQIKPMSSFAAGENIACQFCQQILQQAKDILQSPAIIDQIKQQLGGFCDFLAIIGQDKECRQILDNYLDQAISFIQNLSPKEYCAALSFCTLQSKSPESLASSQTRKQATLSQLANLPSLTDFQDFGLETSVVIGEKLEKSAAAQATATKSISGRNHRAGPNCMLCKTIVKELFHFLHENKTEANIMRGLEEICSLVYKPGTKRDQCDSMVRAYTREIVQLMIDETDPEVICMLLEQCAYENDAGQYKSLSPSATSHPASTGQQFEMADLITALDNTIQYKSVEACFECKIFIKFIRQKASEEKTQEGVKNWLLANLCKQLPDQDLIGSCSAMVEKNSATFFRAVLGLLDPKMACKDLGVCAAKSMVSVFNLENSSLQSGLRGLPMLLSSQRNNVASETNRKISNRPAEFGGQMCDQCVQIASQIVDYLKDHPFDQDVTAIIDNVCNNLPEGTLRGECTYIVKAFGEEIVQAITTMDNPRQLCSKIYLCQAGAVN